MLEPATRISLCELLLQQAKVEKQIEVVRQLLCEQVSFIPFSAFQKLDTLGCNAVNASDLREFLIDLGFPHSLSESELAISQYDVDTDSKMNYNEFLRATLTHDDSNLRNSTTQRIPQDYLQGSKSIPYDVEYTLAKLFELEIRCQIDLESLKAIIANQRDFSIQAAFTSLDRDNMGRLSPRNFESFFKLNQFTVYEDEIDCLFRRIDYDNDGFISYSDFAKGISPISNPLGYQHTGNIMSSSNQSYHRQQQQSSQQYKSPVKGILKATTSGSKFYSPPNDILNTEPVHSFYQDSELEVLKQKKIDNDLRNSQLEQQLLQSKIQDIQQESIIQEHNNRIKKQQEEEQLRADQVILQESIILEKQQQENLRRNMDRDERQYQLEKSVERLHRQVQRQNQLDLLNQKQSHGSPRPGGTVGSILRNSNAFSRSPRMSSSKTHSAQYSNRKTNLEKKMQKVHGKQEILDQSYISQKPTFSSMQKKTPKKNVEIDRNKPFTCTKSTILDNSTLQASHNQPWYGNQNNSSTMLSSSQKKKPQQQQSAKKNTRTPRREQGSQSPIIANRDSSAQKYSNLKASIRGKMAKIRQSGEIPQQSTFQNSSHKKNSLSQSQQSFRPSSVKKQQSNRKKSIGSSSKKQSQYPSSFTKSSINNGLSSSKKSRQNNSVVNNNNASMINSFNNFMNGSGQKSGRQASASKQMQQSEIFGINSQQSQQQSSKKKQYSSRRQRVNDELIELIQNVINLEKKVERNKQDLALRPDFNLMDTFRYIDKQSRGLISSLLLEDFLKELQVRFNIEDLFLFMRRFDNDNDGKLRFSDFSDFVTPRQFEFAQILERREATYPDFQLSLQEILSFETVKLLKQLFKCHLECEVLMESLRKQIQKSANFDYHEGFKILDTRDDGYISNKEILIFFQRNGQVITEKEIDYFIGRFDKEGDNVITFGEFVEELSPRSNKIPYNNNNY